MNNTKKIGIIGAGAAGVHMAVELKKRGCEDIIIFEKSDRIGGKTCSIQHNGLSHEMGTTAFAMTKGSSLERFIKDIFPRLEAVSYKTKIKTLAKYTFFKIKNKRSFPLRKVSNIFKYLYCRYKFYKIYNALIKKGYPYKMDANDIEITALLAQSIKSFLLQNKLGLIYHILKSRFAAYGYGNMDHLPAYYGILLLERNYLSHCEYLMLNEGNDFLWKKAIEKYNICVQLNTTVSQIKTKQDGKPTLKIKNGQTELIQEFDAVFLTVPYAFSAQLPKKVSEVFKDVKYYQYLSSLIEMSNRDNSNRYYVGEYPIHSYKHFNYDTVMAANFSKIKNTSNVKSKEVNGTFVCFQLKDSEREDVFNQEVVLQQLAQQIKENFDRKNGLDKVLNTFHWHYYFPHLPSDKIENGAIHQIESEQGKFGVYYIGSSVSGELVSLVVEYNDHILQNVFIT